jgi:hypothetical protein
MSMGTLSYSCSFKVDVVVCSKTYPLSQLGGVKAFSEQMQAPVEYTPPRRDSGHMRSRMGTFRYITPIRPSEPETAGLEWTDCRSRASPKVNLARCALGWGPGTTRIIPANRIVYEGSRKGHASRTPTVWHEHSNRAATKDTAPATYTVVDFEFTRLIWSM